MYQALGVCAELTAPGDGSSGQLKVCVDALLHLNDLLFQLRHLANIRVAGEAFILFANVIYDVRVHLSTELVDQLTELEAQSSYPHMAPGLWRARYARHNRDAEQD